MSNATPAHRYLGKCRNCERDIVHRHPRTSSEFGEPPELRVRCRECGTTNCVKREAV